MPLEYIIYQSVNQEGNDELYIKCTNINNQTILSLKKMFKTCLAGLFFT